MKYLPFAVLLIVPFLFVRCQSFDSEHDETGAITDSLLTATYPELYQAVYERDADRLQPYLDHELPEIREQAWRALTNTPVDDLNQFLDKAEESHSPVSWFALSRHPFKEQLLRELETLWTGQPEKREGICMILGQQGDRQSMRFLFEHLRKAAGSTYEFQFALALGRLMTRFNVKEENQRALIEQAFSSSNPEITRAYLYGYYRGDIQELSADLENHFYKYWRAFGLGLNARVDQYVARILNDRVFYDLAVHYNAEHILEGRVQLAVELAQVLEGLELKSRYQLPVKILFIHPNPHVVHQALGSLRGKLSRENPLYVYIRDDLLSSSDTDPFVWIRALGTAAGVDRELIEKHSSRLEEIEREHPYLLAEVLYVYHLQASADRFLDKISGIVDEGDPLRALLAVRELGAYWNSLPVKEKTSARTEQMREIVLQALSLQDRGVAFALQGLLADDSLFDKDDFSRINRTLSAFRLPEDIEVYQAFGRLYKQRFEGQAQPVIDSLASLGYPPLNRSLAQAGWEVDIPAQQTPEFREPGWDRLWALGRKPLWILETEKGTIKIRLNVLSAPATVSAIDSLTRAGVYNSVPFHRVVPNFVIQGGDVERADGFGGPDFVIPTEANETGFYRGAVGIASAGTDTEGSQYFIMHQWKPHLDGRYTQFGAVVEGMDVVDRIVEGDSVRYAYWE